MRPAANPIGLPRGVCLGVYFAFSNSSKIAWSGAGVSWLTTTMATQATMKAGSSS